MLELRCHYGIGLTGALISGPRDYLIFSQGSSRNAKRHRYGLILGCSQTKECAMPRLHTQKQAFPGVFG